MLGLGNLICSDDGVGVLAAQHLQAQRAALPPGVTVLDGGTLGLSLLPYVEDADVLLLLDAVRAEKSAGQLVRLTGEQVITAVRERLSAHQLGVAELLSAARLQGRYPRRVTLLGLVPAHVGLGTELSAPVAAGLDTLVAAAKLELATMDQNLVQEETSPCA